MAEVDEKEPELEITDTDGGFEVREVEAPEEDASESDEPKLTRKQKKSNRFRELQEERDSYRKELENLRRRIDSMEREPRTPRTPPEDAEIQRLERERQNLSKRAQAEAAKGDVDPTTWSDYERQAQELVDKQTELRVQKAVRSQMGTVQTEARIQAQRARYSDINANPAMGNWAKAHWQQLVAEEVHAGRSYEEASQDVELTDRAAEATRARFGLKKSSPPSSADKARLSATGGNPAGAAPKKGGVFVGKAQVEMAKGMYPDLPVKEAIKKWSAKVGRKVESLKRG